MPFETISWKSAIPLASILFLSASWVSLWRINCIRWLSCSALSFSSMDAVSPGGKIICLKGADSIVIPLGSTSLARSVSICLANTSLSAVYKALES